MKLTTSVFLSVLVGTVWASVPELRDVTVAQNNETREVTIDYRLAGEPAVVTVDVLTNGISIGYANMKGFVGAVYYTVPPTEGDAVHHISWRPDRYWPDGGKIQNGSVSFKLTAWATNAPPDWLVVNLFQTGLVNFYPDPELFPAGPELTNNVYKADYLVMRKIHAAGKTFIMGELGNASGYKAQRTVSFSRDFYISIFNLTEGQYNQIAINAMANYSVESWARKPKTIISWADMNTCAGLATTRFAGLISPNVTLLTSAQWEFACRAGTVGARPFPDADLDEYAWYAGNAPVANQVQEVGLLKPNPWSLYDMIGNVNEFTSDTANSGLVRCDEPVLDPSFSGNGNKVYRGGAVNEGAENQTSYMAGGFGSSNFNVGFRLGWTLP